MVEVECAGLFDSYMGEFNGWVHTFRVDLGAGKHHVRIENLVPTAFYDRTNPWLGVVEFDIEVHANDVGSFAQFYVKVRDGRLPVVAVEVGAPDEATSPSTAGGADRRSGPPAE